MRAVDGSLGHSPIRGLVVRSRKSIAKQSKGRAGEKDTSGGKLPSMPVWHEESCKRVLLILISSLGKK